MPKSRNADAAVQQSGERPCKEQRKYKRPQAAAASSGGESDESSITYCFDALHNLTPSARQEQTQQATCAPGSLQIVADSAICGRRLTKRKHPNTNASEGRFTHEIPASTGRARGGWLAGAERMRTGWGPLARQRTGTRVNDAESEGRYCPVDSDAEAAPSVEGSRLHAPADGAHLYSPVNSHSAGSSLPPRAYASEGGGVGAPERSEGQPGGRRLHAPNSRMPQGASACIPLLISWKRRPKNPQRPRRLQKNHRARRSLHPSPASEASRVGGFCTPPMRNSRMARQAMACIPLLI